MESFRPCGAPGDADVAAAFDRGPVRRALGDLMNPRWLAAEAPILLAELAKVLLGRSEVVPERDARCTDPTWRENLFCRRLGQSHLLWDRSVGALIDWQRQAGARHLASVLGAPAHPLSDPGAGTRIFGSGRASLLQGPRPLVRPVGAHRGMPSLRPRPFVGVTTPAVSPGAVVYREELFELVHYAPTTETVRERPLLMVSPQRGRCYPLDLAQGRSLVEYAVSLGVETFMVVWRDGGHDPGHGYRRLADYLAAHLRAFDVVREITDADEINLLGWCAGGVTCALSQAQLAARADNPVHTCTYLASALDVRMPKLAEALSALTCENFMVARLSDWPMCSRGGQLLGGPTEVVIVDNGRRRSFVPPVVTSRHRYWAGPADGSDAEAWLTARDPRTGSWWPHWAGWLLPRSGEERPAPTTLGGICYPVHVAAPGRSADEK